MHVDHDHPDGLETLDVASRPHPDGSVDDDGRLSTESYPVYLSERHLEHEFNAYEGAEAHQHICEDPDVGAAAPASSNPWRARSIVATRVLLACVAALGAWKMFPRHPATPGAPSVLIAKAAPVAAPETTWYVAKVLAEGVIVRFGSAEHPVTIGEVLPNGDTLKSVRPGAATYVTDHAMVVLTGRENLHQEVAQRQAAASGPSASASSAQPASAPVVANAKPGTTMAATKVAAAAKPARDVRRTRPERALPAGDGSGRAAEPTSTSTSVPAPAPGVTAAAARQATRADAVRGRAVAVAPPESAVPAAGADEAKIATRADVKEFVSADQAGISNMDASGVQLKGGARVPVGGRFPSGEKLLSVNPGQQVIITDTRTISIF